MTESAEKNFPAYSHLPKIALIDSGFRHYRQTGHRMYNALSRLLNRSRAFFHEQRQPEWSTKCLKVREELIFSFPYPCCISLLGVLFPVSY